MRVITVLRALLHHVRVLSCLEVIAEPLAFKAEHIEAIKKTADGKIESTIGVVLSIDRKVMLTIGDTVVVASKEDGGVVQVKVSLISVHSPLFLVICMFLRGNTTANKLITQREQRSI